MTLRSHPLLTLTALVAVASSVVAMTPHAASADLPDGRVFERVSPQDTRGVGAYNQSGSRSRAIDDDTVLYIPGAQPIGDTPSGYGAPLVARRSPAGWMNSTLASGTRPELAYNTNDATPDARILVLAYANAVNFGVPPDLEYPQGIAVRGVDGEVRLVVADDGPSGPTGQTFYNGMSADGGTLVYTSDHPAADVPADDTGQHVYRWTTSGVTRVAGGTDPLADCTLDAGLDAGFSSLTRRRTNGVSADARTVFVKVTGGSGCPVGQIYRTGPDGSRPVSEPVGATGFPPASFVSATPDGDHAIIASAADLTPDSSDTNGASDLYSWTAGASPSWRCISCGAANGIDPQQLARAFPSRDGKSLWFPATGVIQGQGAPGQERTFVTDGTAVRAVPLTESNDVVGATPDARIVVLRVAATGALVRATAATGSDVGLTDVSGGLPAKIVGAEATLEGPDPRGASGLAGTGGQLISDDGQTIAFSASAALTGGDASDQNVYRWTPGSTESLAADDRIAPGPQVSPTGKTVFLYSDSALTADTTQRELSTLFAARIGGGFPPPARPAAPCVADTCRPPDRTSPVAPAPGSVASAAVGNAAPVKAEGTPRVTLVRLSAATRRTLARTGRASIRLRSTRPGSVTVKVTARVRGRSREIARATSRVSVTSKTVAVSLRLSSAARVELRRTRRLRMTIAVSSQGARTVRQTVTLSIPKRG